MGAKTSWRIKIQGVNGHKLAVWQKHKLTGGWIRISEPAGGTLLTGAGNYTARFKVKERLGTARADQPANLKIKIWFKTADPFRFRTKIFYTNVGSGSKRSWRLAQTRSYSYQSSTNSTSSTASTPSGNTTQGTTTKVSTKTPLYISSITVHPESYTNGNGSTKVPPAGAGLVEEPVVITKTSGGLTHDTTDTVVDPATGKEETIVVDTVETFPEDEKEVAVVDPLDAEVVADAVVDEILDTELPEGGSVEVADEASVLPDDPGMSETELAAFIQDAPPSRTAVNLTYIGGGALVGVVGATMVQGNRVGGAVVGGAAGYLLSALFGVGRQ